MRKLRKIIISGGGTGGHIYPAVAVAQELQKRIPDIDILFVGASDRMEMEKVPKAGYKIEGLWISGLQRSLSFKNLLFPIKVLSAVWHARQIIKKFNPDIAIGFGGYASGALMWAATSQKIPTLIHEQNSYAGITNKILKNRVDTICVAYDQMHRFFPEQKIVKVGNPIRKDLIQVASKREQAIAHFGLNHAQKTVLVIGGSLGARTINKAVFNGLKQLEDAGLQLIWQTGKSFNADANHLPSSAKVLPFIYEMDLAYAAADIVVSRAGALSIAELAQVQKPVILVPSPNVAEDHQTKNAMALVNREAAILVTDTDAPENLINEVIKLAANDMKQAQLKNNIASFAMPDAAKRIVDELIRLIA
ncbi:MAG: undecaprenyldiphospho-muramoylpentapeptide beta-N-acetylglucosaminyltransferase [Bacteroidia bacterium]|jgi:UDP-N-acetylglucosamine--N-acetylmuramyl-(pentapeptide) pyrophosphoryl-undecaprenol N-acetylglucosamine transferase|nr:undecaprenyldiphospho-muramoylpentapeptide beta-N-acetylglucosaminyltransferase [Bacteroidia bacterium]